MTDKATSQARRNARKAKHAQRWHDVTAPYADAVPRYLTIELADRALGVDCRDYDRDHDTPRRWRRHA